MRYLNGYSATVAMLIGFVSYAAAVNVAVAADADNRIIEEVLVVSTKRARAEAVQDVPVASTVVSAAMIEENNYIDLVEVAHMAPNANFRETSTFPGIQRFWIRAVGVTFSVPNFDPAVGVYQDGVFIAQNIAAVLDTFDMESIEILRGPQGTLFGRNTSVGAVVTRSKRPSDAFELQAEATIGSYERNDYLLSVGGPIVADTLKGKLAVMSRNTDEGWIDNTAPGGDDVGDSERLHLRGTLVWSPSEAFEVTLIGEHYERDGDGAWAVPLGVCDRGRDCHGLGLPARDWDETFEDGFPWETHSDHEIDKFVMEANWNLDHGVVTSVTGYLDMDAHSGSNFEGVPPFIITTRLNIVQDQFSQEIRYASDFSDQYDFTIGGYYFTQDLEYGEQRAQGSRVGVAQPGVPDPLNPFGFRPPGFDQLEHESWAVFAEGRYHVTDRLSVTAGGRYTDESKDVNIGLVLSGSCNGNTTPPFVGTSGWSCTRGAMGGWDIVDDESWRSFSPKLGLEFRPNDDMLLYSTLTRGFRSGGFSFRASALELGRSDIRPAFYGRERVDSLELGMKSDWWDNRLRFNVTGFYQWWDGIQRNLQQGSIGNIIQRTANVEDSHVYGIEVETNAILGLDVLTEGDMFRIDGSLGFAESGYDSDYIVNGQDLSDEKFAAPHETLYLGLTYEHPVGAGGGTLSWRTTYFYMGGWRSEGPNRPTAIEEYRPQRLLEASVQYVSGDGRWYGRVFGKNLTDYQYYQGRVPFANSFGVGLPGAPRMFGVTVGYRN